MLAIAIDQYRSPSFVSLSNAVSDATKVLEVLCRRYGFELAHEPLFNEKATRSNIYGVLTELVAGSDDRDDLVLYFAGHGLQHTLLGIGYWIPCDATEDVSSYISNAEIKNYLSGIRARHIFVLSDSCFSGTFVAPTGGGEWNQAYTELNRDFSRIMLTSGGEEAVSDGVEGKTSPFTRYLLRYWNENTNELSSITELMTYVSAMTSRFSGQRPRGARIDGVGDNRGEMIFMLKEEWIETRRQENYWAPHTLTLKLELYSVLGPMTSRISNPKRPAIQPGKPNQNRLLIPKERKKPGKPVPSKKRGKREG